MVVGSTMRDHVRKRRRELGLAANDLHHRLQQVGATELLAAIRDVKHAHRCTRCAEPMVLDHSPHGSWIHCPDYAAGCKGKRHLGRNPRRALETLPASR